MKISFISEKAWREFQENHPDAYAFLLHESLIGEQRYLNEQPALNGWEYKRLRELNELWEKNYGMDRTEPSTPLHFENHGC